MKAAAFAPATVSNVGCGFDVLGFALEQPGDVVVAIARERAGVAIIEITGDDGRLSKEVERNSASVAARALLQASGSAKALPYDVAPRPDVAHPFKAANGDVAHPFRAANGDVAHPFTAANGDVAHPFTAANGGVAQPFRAANGSGVDLIVRKGLPLASGIGSSGASAVAAVLAVNEALGLRAPVDMLLRSAMEGERVAAGAAHPDNVAPSLLGGFVLARSVDPPDVVRLPVPPGLACAVLHPALEIETRAARAVLPEAIPLVDAVRQWANVGALVAALHAGDLDLLGRAMIDHVVERHRAHLVPGFARIKDAAIEAGAIGSNLSGAGPSMFALCRSIDVAHRVGDAMHAALRTVGVRGQVFVSRVAVTGARLVDAVD